MKRTGLILNKSYNDFILGTSITNYMNMPHRIECLNDPQLSMDFYAFFKTVLNMEYGVRIILLKVSAVMSLVSIMDKN